jgi:hypothetical protein
LALRRRRRNVRAARFVLERQGRPSFSEEKEAKRLSVLRAAATISPKPAGPKVFLVTFFSKK